MVMHAATAKANKVLRLLAEGRVVEDPVPAQVYRVEGDTGTYTVIAGAHVALCTCPAQTRCSHIEAAVLRANASPMERALMDAAVDRRQAENTDRAEQVFARVA
jgi:uncharacterized Zn finger protein